MGFLPSIVALSTMAAVAVYLTIARGGIRADASALRHAAYVALLATVLQVGHFLEEAGMGLNQRFPEFFGLAPVPMESFVTINLVALAIWVISVFALAQGASVALFPLWFLSVACVANAVLHPALSLASGAISRDCLRRRSWAVPVSCCSVGFSVLPDRSRPIPLRAARQSRAGAYNALDLRRQPS